MPPCKKCKNVIPDGAVFCPWCGMRQERLKGVKKRGNGGGYAFKRGDTWTVRIRRYVAIPAENDIDNDIDVKCQETTKGGFATKKDALAYGQVMLGKSPRPTKTLADYWQLYSHDKLLKLSDGKQANYQKAYERMRGIALRDISTLTISDLQSVVSQTTSTFYPARDIKTLFSALFRMAAADGVANKDLPSFIELPKLNEKKREAFTPQEIQRIHAQWESGDMIAGYILVMIGTGMMPGELLRLEKSMIHLDLARIIGAGLKTDQRKKQSIVLPPPIVKILRSLMEKTPGEKLFDGYYYEKFSAQYYATLEAAGCRKLPPYSCRHSTATYMAQNPEIPPAVISRVMRHSARMTERYTHIDDTPALEAAEKMGDFFATGYKRGTSDPKRLEK